MRTRKDVAALMERIFDDCRFTREAGQAEYAHDEENALANFDSDAERLGVDRKVSWSIFANKHWRGIHAYIRGHKSQREDVRGRIKDLIVYLVLLWAMIDDEEESFYAQDVVVAEEGPTRNQALVKQIIDILQGVR